MAKRTWQLIFIVSWILSGCSAGILADREDEYKQAQELPPLEVPPDLTSSTIEDPSIQLPDVSGSTSFTEYVGNQSPDSEAAPDAEQSPKLITGDGEPYIEIGADFPKSWRMVGKALSNLGLEVTDRDRSAGDYYVIFGENSGGIDEEGLLASLAFWRDVKVRDGGEKFLVRLEEAGQITKVIVLDSDKNTQRDGDGFELLKKVEAKLNEK